MRCCGDLKMYFNSLAQGDLLIKTKVHTMYIYVYTTYAVQYTKQKKALYLPHMALSLFNVKLLFLFK